MSDQSQDKTLKFAEELRSKEGTGKESNTVLATSDRVLARITDGIYRQPSSALRELISNAYDADATEVIIQTDAPKFDKITIRDNGNGMSYEALSNMIHNIGGSIKRTARDNNYGVVDNENPNLSPVKKRKLIGKIGIGLFAVSQLTHHFQIITKRKGDNFRLIADIVLKTYTEDELESFKSKKERKFETGTVVVKSIKDPNTQAHGTDIILLKLKKNSQDLLRSRERWLRILSPEALEEGLEEEPAFHIGKINVEDGTTISRASKLPWKEKDSPEEKFFKLTQAVLDQVGIKHPRPKLSNIFDNYLNTIWTLSLSAPLPYVEKHPFDLNQKDGIRAFLLANDKKGQAKEITLTGKSRIRDEVGLTTPDRDPEDKFNIYFDDVLLKRPILYKRLPETTHAIKTPLIFVGKCIPNLGKIPESIRGGNLSFEAYLFWNSKIVPLEHNGVLLRIHDASGALFDETFLKYQVSEQTRLRQLTAEIFIKEGLDAALNIDRESFNYAHPHYQFLTQWLHRAIRQFTNKHKAIGSEIRDNVRVDQQAQKKSRASGVAEKQWQKYRKENISDAPKVSLVAQEDVQKERSEGSLAFNKSQIIPPNILSSRRADLSIHEQKIESLITILEAYNLLEDMPYERQEELIKAIADLFLGDYN